MLKFARSAEERAPLRASYEGASRVCVMVLIRTTDTSTNCDCRGAECITEKKNVFKLDLSYEN